MRVVQPVNLLTVATDLREEMESGRRIFFDPSCRNNMVFLGIGPRSVLNIEDQSKKRPFFRSPEELYDEEYFDEQLPEKKRRLTAEQLNLLEKSFEVENKLEPERKIQLAKELGLQPRQVAVWFQNRRARWKTKQLERDYDQLKSSYDSLSSNYDSILKQNDKLKAELLALTEKLQPKLDPVVGEADQKSDSVVKGEDRVSTGSAGSAVVDEDSHQLDLDSSDSYFRDNEYPGCCCDDDIDGGPRYFSDVLDQDQEQIGWCIWS